MKHLLRLLLVVTAFLPQTLLASQHVQPSVASLVDQFYALNLTKPFTHPPRDCDDDRDRRTCADVACEKLGQFGCDDMNEINAVNRACRGNSDGLCLGAVCNRLGQFGCDDIAEVQKVARGCVGNRDMKCFESVCNRLGQFGCDDAREVEEVLRSCAGN